MQEQVRLWLSAINSKFELQEGECCLQHESGIPFSVMCPQNSDSVTFLATLFELPSLDIYVPLLQQALILNLDAEKMKGCWLGLSGNSITLCRTQSIESLDEVGFYNVFMHFFSLALELRDMEKLSTDSHSKIDIQEKHFTRV